LLSDGIFIRLLELRVVFIQNFFGHQLLELTVYNTIFGMTLTSDCIISDLALRVKLDS
jgi:hypothetical protein